jgi:hypothetical protein
MRKRTPRPPPFSSMNSTPAASSAWRRAVRLPLTNAGTTSIYFFRRMVTDSRDRRSFIGGSDARIIMGDDETALLRLWREKRRGRARGPFEQPDRPARHRDRTSQPALVREKHRPGRDRGAASGVSSDEALDGGNAGRHSRGNGCRLRGQVHAPLVVLGGRRGRETHGPAAIWRIHFSDSITWTTAHLNASGAMKRRCGDKLSS